MLPLKLLLLLSHFSRVQLCATPEMAAHQAPLSLGFSRQEQWSGLPFLSPMHKSESEVAQSCPTLSDPMDCSPPGSSVHGIFQARVLEWGAIPFSNLRSLEIEIPCPLKARLWYSGNLYIHNPGGSDGKESTCNARDLGLIPGSGRSPGEGNGNPLQYSCLGNCMD